MPASAVQLLLAGVTSARDLGAPLEASRSVKERVERGDIPGPRLYMSGPFLQAEVDDWQKGYRWPVRSVGDARQKVRTLSEAGMDIVKLVDQDKLPRNVAQAIVDEAHAQGMKVVAHSHRPDEIRIGLEIGVDNFEHTGLTTAPGVPAGRDRRPARAHGQGPRCRRAAVLDAHGGRLVELRPHRREPGEA